MLVCFFGVEWGTYGSPFGSLSEFYQYNLANRVEYATRYGECPPPGFYLSELTKFFSYLVPVFAVIGIAKIVMGGLGVQGVDAPCDTCPALGAAA